MVREVEVGSHASLKSHFMEELAHGQPCLSIDSPSTALAELPAFLVRTCIPKLIVKAPDPVAAAKADRVLPHCASITDLECHHGTPARFPPSMVHLTLYRPGCSEDADDHTVAALQHVQLVRLQDATSLRRVYVMLHLDLETELTEETCMVDLNAFTAAAACTAQLEVCMSIKHVALVSVSYRDFLHVVMSVLTVPSPASARSTGDAVHTWLTLSFCRRWSTCAAIG